jgi:hypothetical protein
LGILNYKDKIDGHPSQFFVVVSTIHWGMVVDGMDYFIDKQYFCHQEYQKQRKNHGLLPYYSSDLFVLVVSFLIFS